MFKLFVMFFSDSSHLKIFINLLLLPNSETSFETSSTRGRWMVGFVSEKKKYFTFWAWFVVEVERAKKIWPELEFSKVSLINHDPSPRISRCTILSLVHQKKDRTAFQKVSWALESEPWLAAPPAQRRVLNDLARHYIIHFLQIFFFLGNFCKSFWAQTAKMGKIMGLKTYLKLLRFIWWFSLEL